jgi:hypothetical protein
MMPEWKYEIRRRLVSLKLAPARVAAINRVTRPENA